MHEVTDENDLDFAIAVFRAGTRIDKEEDHSDCVGTYHGIRSRQQHRIAVGIAKP